MNKNAAAEPQHDNGVVLAFSIGDRLRKARTHFNATISQDDFAALIGASGNTVSNYENDVTTRLKDIYIQKWADVTGVSYWWLKTGLDSPTGGGTALYGVKPLHRFVGRTGLEPVTDGLWVAPVTQLIPRAQRNAHTA